LTFKDLNPYEGSKRASRNSAASKQNTQGETVTTRGNYFREELLRHLGFNVSDSSNSTRSNGMLVKCMVSGKESSKEDDIRAAHIVPAVSKHSLLQALKFTPNDLNDVRNGLLLAYGIEREFDSLGVSFVQHPLRIGVLLMKVWSETAKKRFLFKGTDKEGYVADYDGFELNLAFDGGKHNPFCRGLAFQAHQAYLKWNFINPSLEPVDYSSDLNTPFSRHRLLGLKYLAEEFNAGTDATNDTDNGASLVASSVEYDNTSSGYLKRRRVESEDEV
jgi:hypothetical protein